MQVDRQGNECMQSILVLIGGGEGDDIIIRTAHAAAVPPGAHLDFLHVRVSAPVAMRHDEQAQFAMGAGMQNALQDFDNRASTFSQLASDHALGFVKLLEERRTTEGTPITASYREVHDAPIERLIEEACNHDLVVIGRARQKQGLAQSTLEMLIPARQGSLPPAQAQPRPKAFISMRQASTSGSENGTAITGTIIESDDYYYRRHRGYRAYGADPGHPFHNSGLRL